MTRTKLNDQFDELVDCVREVYQKHSLSFRYCNEQNDDDPNDHRIPASAQSIDDGESQPLFDDEIARISELVARVKRHVSVFSRFGQFSMNVRKYREFYDQFLLKDLGSILKQVVVAVDTQSESERSNDLSAYIERYLNLNLSHYPGVGHPKLNLAKLKYESTDEPTEFDRKQTEWRKSLKKLNKETNEMMSLFRLLNNGRLVCFMKAQNVINIVRNFKEDRSSGDLEAEPNKPTKLETDHRSLKKLIDLTDAAICKLVEETTKFENFFSDSLAKFDSLMEEGLILSEQIYSGLIERLHPDEDCGESPKNDGVSYRQLVAKLPIDSDYLRSLKMA